MKVYLSGAITSPVPNYTKEALKGMFRTYQAQLEKEGYEVVNPLDVLACADNSCGEGPSDHTWECWLKYDLIEMLKCDAIFMLPFWSRSRGARLEFSVATSVGMEVLGL